MVQNKYNDKISVLIKKLITLTRENKIKWKFINESQENNNILINYLKSEQKISNKVISKKPIIEEKTYFTFINNGYIYLLSFAGNNKNVAHYLLAAQTKKDSQFVELNKSDSVEQKHQDLLDSLVNIIEDNDIDDFINSILVID